MLKTTFNLSHSPEEEFYREYLRWPEAVREITLRTAVEEKISTRYIKATADEISSTQGKVKKEIANIFGGDNALSELERSLGIRVKGPTISAIRMDEEAQKAKSVEQKVTSLAGAIHKLMHNPDGTPTGLTIEEASRSAQVIMDFITRTEIIYDVKGLNNAHSVWLGGGMGSVNPAVGTTTTGGKNKGKK